jgi:hypothetical protein
MSTDAGYGVSDFKTKLMYKLHQVMILLQGFGLAAVILYSILL